MASIQLDVRQMDSISAEQRASYEAQRIEMAVLPEDRPVKKRSKIRMIAILTALFVSSDFFPTVNEKKKRKKPFATFRPLSEEEIRPFSHSKQNHFCSHGTFQVQRADCYAVALLGESL